MAFQGRIYVFRGESIVAGATFDQAERYDPEAGTWTGVTSMPVARHGLGGGVLAVGIVLVGGGPRPGLGFSVHTGIWRP